MQSPSRSPPLPSGTVALAGEAEVPVLILQSKPRHLRDAWGPTS